MNMFRMHLLIVAAALAVSGCSGQLANTTFENGIATGLIYPIPQERADKVITAAILEVFPGSQVNQVDFPARGYAVTLRFGLDTHVVSAVAVPQSGTDPSGKRITGYSFRVTHSGTMPLSGATGANSIFDKINSYAASVHAPVRVTSVADLDARELASVEDDQRFGKLEAWCDGLMSRPEIQALSDKIPLRGFDAIGAPMLSIESIPTKAEVAGIRAYADARSQCRSKTVGEYRVHAPQRVPLLEEIGFKSDLVIAQLISRRISYGNANRLLKEAYLAGLSQWSEATRRELAEAQQMEMQRRDMRIREQRAEAEEQAARAATLATLPKPAQPLILQSPSVPNQSVRTYCYWVGSTLSCNSQ